MDAMDACYFMYLIWILFNNLIFSENIEIVLTWNSYNFHNNDKDDSLFTTIAWPLSLLRHKQLKYSNNEGHYKKIVDSGFKLL